MIDGKMVAVCSRSFSRFSSTRQALEYIFPNVQYNSSKYSLSGCSLERFLSNAHVAIIGLEVISRRLIEQCPKLSIICKMGTGTDKIDFQASWGPSLGRNLEEKNYPSVRPQTEVYLANTRGTRQAHARHAQMQKGAHA